MKSRYICPKCRKELVKSGNSYVCPDKHCYDISAEGYVNLAANGSFNENSGDAADTCRARRRFLEAGYYKELAEKICEMLKKYMPNRENLFIIDAGSGEGYYSRFVRASFENPDIYGIDLAKQGVKMAAKFQKNLPLKVHYAVAGIFDMPFSDESADAVISVFAPVADAESQRVLKKGGVLIVAGPGKKHLYGLKSMLYDTPTENEEKIPEYPGLILEESVEVQYEMQLTGPAAQDLFAMTPYFWRSSREIREKSEKLENVTTMADFLVKVYIKK